MTRTSSTPADHGTYIGLLRDDARRACDELVQAGGRPVCCADRPQGERSYACLCGHRWRLTHDGWIKVGPAGELPSPWEA